MRTVILLSGLAIAQAIRVDWYNKDSVGVYFIILLFCIIMDLIEFLYNTHKKS